MNDPTRPELSLRMAAINALHEAEEAGRPISARVDAVMAALQARAAPPPDREELAHHLRLVLEALERRLMEACPEDPDRAIARAARAALGMPEDGQGR